MERDAVPVLLARTLSEVTCVCACVCVCPPCDTGSPDDSGNSGCSIRILVVVSSCANIQRKQSIEYACVRVTADMCDPPSSESASGNLARACGADGRQPCPTTQSTTASSGASSRAVDANTNTNYPGGSCTHTATHTNPWWRVDLTRTRSVMSVKIWNRADCCSDRLRGFEVWIGDDASSYSANLRCSTGGTAQEEQHVDCIGTGRYLFVALPGNAKTLTLCEVEVYGLYGGQGERS